MVLVLVKIVGRLVCLCPEPLLALFAQVVGSVFYWAFIPRRRLMLRSLEASFPGRTQDWRRRCARRSCVRLLETGLLSLATPFLPEERILKIGKCTASFLEYFRVWQQAPRSLVLGTAHLAYWEGLCWLPKLAAPQVLPVIVTIFRPMRDPSMDSWLKETRERFGVKLLSRRAGLHASLHVLQKGDAVGILFDQSAGSHGYLTRFLGRECSTTPLPGILVERTKADCAFVYARRLSFWRFEIDIMPIASPPEAKELTLALNRALEKVLTEDDNLCESWLWLHQRWRVLDRPEELQKLKTKRGDLIG